MCRFAYTSYEEILYELRNCLRGQEFIFVSQLIVLDEMLIDICPLIVLKKNMKRNSFQNNG